MKTETMILLAVGLGLGGYGAYKIFQEVKTKEAQGPLYKPNFAIPVLMIGGGLALSIPALEKVL